MTATVSALVTAALALLALGPAPVVAPVLAPVSAPVSAPAPAAAAGAPPVLTALDVTTGNLTGGTVVTLSVGNVRGAVGTSVTVGGKSAVVLGVVPDVSVTIETPGIDEPTGEPVDVVLRTKDGIATLPAAFTYTPTLHVQVLGSAAAGGGLVLDWTAAGLDPVAVMTVWLGNPALPDFAQPLPGYAGILYEEPGLAFFTVPASAGGIVLHFPKVPAWLVGFPLHLQGLATKEGNHKGSFTNVATFVLN